MDYQERNEGSSSCRRNSWRYVQPVSDTFDALTESLSDFEKTFIQCIVYNYEALREYKDEASLRAAGKIMTKGKDYVVEVSHVKQRKWPHLINKQDGDIILIKAGAAKS